MSVKKFTVVESKWLRGKRNPSGEEASSCLENLQGEKCCMGFLAEACGVPEDVRRRAHYFSTQVVEPYDDLLPAELRPRPSAWGFGKDPRSHGEIATEIYYTNDTTDFTDEERKEKLKELFAKAGVEVEFVP